MRFHIRKSDVVLTLSLTAASLGVAEVASAQAPVLDATCTASIVLNFSPPAMLVLPPNPLPFTTVTGGGTITNCVALNGGPTTGTISYSLDGNLSCISAENADGTLDIVWSDNTHSYADVTSLLLGLSSVGGSAGLTATVTSGRFAGDQLHIVNVRNPLALVSCVFTGLSQTSGTTSLTFVQPL
jgi:hypothetical protein